MGCRLASLLLILIAFDVVAAPEFPALDGRVVDAAKLLAVDTRQSLDAMLAQHEGETSNQVVVVTLPSLGGYEITDYGYQLGRHWGIGQQDKNNGVLLIIASNERKARIEVGYGLEGVLTDALSRDILERHILPRFRQGDYDGGTLAGVRAILQALEGSYQATNRSGERDQNSLSMIIIGLFVFIFIFSIFNSMRRGGSGRRRRGRGGVVGGGLGGLGTGGFGGGGFGGGGFGGGGGGFGGGGASGGW